MFVFPFFASVRAQAAHAAHLMRFCITLLYSSLCSVYKSIHMSDLQGTYVHAVCCVRMSRVRAWPLRRPYRIQLYATPPARPHCH